MPLTWDCTEVKDYEDLIGTQKGAAVKDAIVWYTAVVEIGHLTEKTFEEFCFRMTFHDSVMGTLLTSDGQPFPIPWLTVKRFIGLKTNVGFAKRQRFITKIVRLSYSERFKPSFDRAMKEKSLIAVPTEAEKAKLNLN